MMAVRFCGACASPWKLAVATGNWFEPTPVISTFSCACATLADISAAASQAINA